MYHWSALTTAQLLCEIPWNIIGASLFFVCWYWTVGFATSRAAFMYFVYGLQFPLFWTTLAVAVASGSPNAEIAGLLYSFLFTFVLTLCVEQTLFQISGMLIHEIVMEYYNLFVSSAGGSGCTIFLRILISSPRYLGNVRIPS
jgi:ABC-type multidrug transport system permease subunit